MATVIRPEISESNEYWISKNRHYELKHFCLQYPQWKKQYSEMTNFVSSYIMREVVSFGGTISDSTSKYATDKAYLAERIKMIEEAAIEADPFLAPYILKGVTEGLSYTCLRTKLGIPCGRDTYYNRYRKFFWILDKSRE